MLLDDILQRITIPTRRSRFMSPPKDTSYLVWYDNVVRRGADLKNCINDHSPALELYSYAPDDVAEKQVEDSLDAACVEWEKTDRQWLDTEQQYMTIYDCYYTEKEN